MCMALATSHAAPGYCRRRKCSRGCRKPELHCGAASHSSSAGGYHVRAGRLESGPSPQPGSLKCGAGATRFVTLMLCCLAGNEAELQQAAGTAAGSAAANAAAAAGLTLQQQARCYNALQSQGSRKFAVASGLSIVQLSAGCRSWCCRCRCSERLFQQDT